MISPTTLRISVLAASLVAAGALAQQSTPQVMTDTAPLPAQERGSTGAIVLERSPVRAQRDRDFEASSPAPGVEPVGRAANRKMLRDQPKSDLAREREAQAIEFYRRGAGSATPN